MSNRDFNMGQGQSHQQDQQEQHSPHRYIGNKIPLVIRLAWVILILWILYYLLSYALPDWQAWMKKS